MSPPFVARAAELMPTALQQLSDLVEQYRVHYGEAAAPMEASAWVIAMARSGDVKFFTAGYAERLVGFAATHETPASLRLGRFWQLRDLFVHPDARRLGIARTLLDVVGQAAAESGALRLSLQTEPTNFPALNLYRGAGFTAVRDLTTLSLDLPA